MLKIVKTLAVLAAFTSLTAAMTAQAEESVGNNDATSAIPDPHHGGHDWHPGWGRDHHPGRGPGWGRHGVTCFARNWRGQTFSAQGWDRWNVQQRALNECFSRSWGGARSCRAIGCR